LQRILSLLKTTILCSVVFLSCYSTIKPQDHPDPPGDPAQTDLIYNSLTFLVDYDDGTDGLAELYLKIDVTAWESFFLDHGHEDRAAFLNILDMDGPGPWNYPFIGNRNILSHLECTPVGTPLIKVTIYELDDGADFILDVIFRGMGGLLGAGIGVIVGAPSVEGIFVSIPVGGYYGQRLGGLIADKFANAVNADDIVPPSDYNIDLDTIFINLNAEGACQVS